MVHFVKQERLWLKKNATMPLGMRFRSAATVSLCSDCLVLADYLQTLWLLVTTDAWLCKVWSVSSDQASFVCAGGRYSRPADGAQKCFAPRGWPTCLRKISISKCQFQHWTTMISESCVVIWAFGQQELKSPDVRVPWIQTREPRLIHNTVVSTYYIFNRA